MRYFFILLLILAQCWGAEISAATREAPAYLSPSVTLRYPWTDGVLVHLKIDEAQCRKRYGKRWESACQVYLGDYGEEVQGVRISPATPGRWTWTDGTALLFTPEKPLTPDAEYKISLANMRLPAQVSLTKSATAFRAMPLAVDMPQWKFWIDPSARGVHVLSATLHFTASVDKQAAVPQFLIPKGADLKLGPAELVWNTTRDQLTISAPVQQLPQKNCEVSLRVPNMRRFLTDEDGLLKFLPAAKDQAVTFPLTAQGAANLFKIDKLTLESARDEQLNQSYEIHLRTSLYAHPQEVLDKLTIIQLPRTLRPEASKPYNWKSAPTVPVAALERGTKLTPISLQPDNSPVADMRFRVSPTPDSYVLIYLPPDFSSATGLAMPRQWRQILHASKHDASLDFLQPGNVLPLNGERKLDICATGITTVEWEVQQVRDPFVALLSSYSERSFTSPLWETNVEMDSISVLFRGTLPLQESSSGTAQFATLDLSPMLDRKDDRRGLMRLVLRGLRDKDNVVETSRMILVTDLGMLVKQSANGAYDVFVNSLQNGTPAAQANVRVLGANGRPVASATTDAQGHAVLPSLTGLEREKRPVAIVAEKKTEGERWGDFAWLPLDDVSLVADYSAFPITGRSLPSSGISAFVFAQRGIFRPGETLHFGCLVRRADWVDLPADMPLTAVLYSPTGAVVLKRSFTAGQNGLADFTWPVPESAPTGRYSLDVTLDSGQILGSGTAKVEEFQPDTLALKAGFIPSKKTGWLRVTPDGITNKGPIVAEARLSTLHGLAAAGHRVTAAMRVSPAVLAFPGYEDYIFHDALPFTGEAAERSLSAVVTNDAGVAQLPLPADLLGGGTVRCDLLVEGFEADGGRAVSQPLQTLVSPLEYMLGYKPAGAVTNLQFIPQGRKAELAFVAVNSDLSRTSTGPLTFTVYARRYVTSLVTDSKGAYRYDESPVDTELTSATHNVAAAAELRWSIPTDKAGEFLLSVRNAEQQVMALIPFTVAGERIAAAESGLAAGMLRLKLDKSTYQSGNDIQLFLSLPYDGTGLITIEREGVSASSWFTAKAGETVQRITIPRTFEGRGYVNVTFVRSITSPDIYMEPSVTAVAPFSAGIGQRDMQLQMSAPKKVLPGETLTLHLHAKEKGKAIVFAVDEGVLQLTRFATPAPLPYLLEDRALDVRTLQTFNLLMPDHARLQGRLPGFGGGMGMPGGRFHNPFKRRDEPPLATWALVDVGPDPVAVSIPIPGYYAGTARIMAVGSAASTVGATQTRVLAAAPLMLTPRLPLTVTPGDRFTGSLLAANSTAKDIRLALHVDSGKGLTLEKAPANTITVPAGKESVIPLQFRALPEPGVLDVQFTATTEDGISVTRKTSISLRPATHARLVQQNGVLAAPLEIKTGRDLFSYKAQSSAAVSGLPLPALRALSRYLESYPYGCLEQCISRAFPCVLLRGRTELLPSEKEQQALITAALERMQADLTEEGLSPWPGGRPSLLLTAYAADLLLTMREQHMGIPDPLLTRLCDIIEPRVRAAAFTLEGSRAAAYGIWVLTREGRVTTQLLEQLRSGLQEAGIDWQSDVTAMLFAASQKLMHVRARDMQPFQTPRSGATGWFDDLAGQSLYTAVLARHFPEKLQDGSIAEDMADSTLMALKSGRYATFSAAQAVRALTALTNAAAPVLDQVSLTCIDRGNAAGTAPAARMQAEGTLLTLEDPFCRAYRIATPPGRTLYWQVTTSGFDKSVPTQAAGQGIRLDRVYRNKAGEVVTSAAQGEELSVTITARANGSMVKDCVLLDLLPGGVEMILSRDGDPETPEGLAHMERRDDRMLVFADVTNQPFTFTYRVRAVNKGIFVLPPAQAEAMYDQSIHAHTAGGTFEVR